jgi:PiT family inorganic phosphate transporter
LFWSPFAGFVLAGALFFIIKILFSHLPELFRAPEGNKSPPLFIRGLLILTCTSVSFSHGSNDGQKGMGLIMLILIGTMPTVYSLNDAVTPGQIAGFHSAALGAEAALVQMSGNAPDSAGDPAAIVTAAVQKKALQPDTVPALAALISGIDRQIADRTSLRDVDQNQVRNVRNDIYLADDALTYVIKSKTISAEQQAALSTFKADGIKATEYIPDWVKVVVALALGMGTMVGWKRIVRTVGEKIGKHHLTYAQGFSAEIVAAGLIQAGTAYNLPMSTTHVLTSGVAGTMATNGTGLQWSTIRNLAMAWIFTLPPATILSGALYTVFLEIF